MADVAAATAVLAAAVNLVAGLFGAWRWWTVAPSRAFWVLARAGQAAAVALAAVAGSPLRRAFIRPTACSGCTRCCRSRSASSPSSSAPRRRRRSSTRAASRTPRAVGRLDEAGQRSVVLAILRRELGVMALAAIVVAFLALRAYGTA